MLGYNTYAAPVIDEQLAREGQRLDDAEHYIINVTYGIERCCKLCISTDVAACCERGAIEAIAPQVFISGENFWDREARGLVTYQIDNDDTFSGQVS